MDEPWCVRSIREHALRRPSAPAVADDPRRPATSYGELWRQASAVATALRGLGARPGDLVAVAATRGTPFVTSALGCWLAGTAYLPLDTTHPLERLRGVTGDAAPAALLVSPQHEGLGGQLGLPELGAGAVAAAARRGDGPAAGPAPTQPRGCANVIYTSGTTGRPKGVEVGHAGLANLVRWHLRAYPIGQDGRHLHTFSLGFDGAGWEIWTTLAAGATLLACPDDVRMVSGRVLETLGSWGATQTTLPTPVAEQVLAAVAAGRAAAPDLRYLFAGGAELRLPAAPPPGLPLVNAYGPTEATVVTTSHPVVGGAAGERPPIGRPIDNVDVVLLGDDGEPVPDGEVGELYIGGAAVALGYRGAPAATEARFPRLPGRAGRWYRSGDLARSEGGVLRYHGRRDGEQLKVRGMRVEAPDIESALMAVRGIDAAAVAVVGHGAEADLVAVAVAGPAGSEHAGSEHAGPGHAGPGHAGPGHVNDGPGPGQVRDPARIRAALAGTLPSGLIPTRYHFVDELPLTANGKIDRARVAELATAAPRHATVPARSVLAAVGAGAVLRTDPMTEW